MIGITITRGVISISLVNEISLPTAASVYFSFDKIFRLINILFVMLEVKVTKHSEYLRRIYDRVNGCIKYLKLRSAVSI